jgi:hypothetical protein
MHLKLHLIKELTTEACAVDLLSNQDWFGAKDNWLKWLANLWIGLSCGKRYRGGMPHATAVPPALCSQFGESLG